MFVKTNGKSRLGILVAVVVLLFAALAVGVGIKRTQLHRTEIESQIEQQQTEPVETRPQEESKLSKMTPEDEEFLQWLDEEIKKLEEEAETMLDHEHMYVSEGQAEVSSLKESMSREKFQAEVVAGRMYEKSPKTKAGYQLPCLSIFFVLHFASPNLTLINILAYIFVFLSIKVNSFQSITYIPATVKE